jgi:hypothetical protein
VLIDFSQFCAGVILVRVTAKRVAKIRALIDDCIRRASLSSGTASTLRGKLFFCCTTSFAKVGIAPLQAFVERQYSRATHITPPIMAALLFFRTFTQVLSLRPRSVTIHRPSRSTLLIWSDAMWEHGIGQVGFVAYDPDLEQFFYSASYIPEWVTSVWSAARTKIGQAEIYAAIFVYLSLHPSMLRKRNVVHFVDNTSAAWGLLKGYSNKADSAHMISIFTMIISQLQCSIWWEYVASKANISDGPSRFDFSLCSALCALYVPMFIMTYDAYVRPLQDWLVPPRPSSKHSGARKRKSAAMRRTSAAGEC